MDASSVRSKPEVSRDEFLELEGVVRDLEQRVHLLEHPPVKSQIETPPPVPALEVSSDLIPALGRTLLAIAGAYLIRLFSELQVLPPRAGIAAGIAYAAAWLWFAGRSKTKVSVTLYSLASMFILAPLLWEATVRLHAIPNWIAASVAALFAIASCFRKDSASFALPACAVIAITLLVGLRDLVPFTFALLAIGAAAEIVCLKSRWVAALLADAGVATFALILHQGLPEDYAPAPLTAALIAQGLLVAIYAGIILTRGRVFTIYEIIQTAVGFLVGAGGALYLTRADHLIGTLCLIGCAASYAIVFLRSAPTRNLYTFAAFSLLLTLAGTFLWISGIALTILWCVLAAAAAGKSSIRFQSPIYLWAATLISPLAMQSGMNIWSVQATAFPFAQGAIVLIAAVASYVILARGNQLNLALATAANAIFIAAGMAACVAAASLVLTLLAILVAAAGARFDRRELVWLMYPLMVLAAARIGLHDFWHESTLLLVTSLLIYGIALMFLPRILAARKTQLPL